MRDAPDGFRDHGAWVLWCLLALWCVPVLALAQGMIPLKAGPAGRGASSSAPVPPRTLVGYGDSIMQGAGGPSPVVPLAASVTPTLVTFNAGVSGETAAQIRARWLATEATSCLGGRCGYVWVEGGINSFKPATVRPVPEVLADMLAVVDDALAKGYVVLWSDVLPCRGWTVDAFSDDTINRVLEYNAGMASACAARAGGRIRCAFNYAAFVDPTRFRADGVTLAGYLLPAYSADELHLNTAGATALAASAKAALGL